MARILPRSTRWRVALFAALTSALVLGLGAYWFVSVLQSGLETNARTRASDKVDALVALLNSGVAPEDVPKRYEKGGGYMISTEVMNRCSAGQAKQFPDDQVVQIYGPDCVIVMPIGLEEGQEYAHVATTDGRYQVDAAERLDPLGLETVATARQLLWGGVPAAALLVGAVAWFAVRRSLRAVGAIRAEVDGIRATGLGRRVPVPDSGDEITELAVTMNEMLARLDQSVRRQSQFTADASHELRTPLASMRTQLEVQLAHPDRLDWRRSIETPSWTSRGWKPSPGTCCCSASWTPAGRTRKAGSRSRTSSPSTWPRGTPATASRCARNSTPSRWCRATRDGWSACCATSSTTPSSTRRAA